MPTYKLKGGVYQNVDEVGLDGLSPILINGFVDEFDNLNKRFGFETWVNINSNQPVKGLFYWQQKGCIIAVSNGNIYKISTDKTVTNKTTNALVNKNNPAIFASDGGATWIASGGKMVLLDWNVSENNAIFVADTDAPTSVSHVAYLDGYVIANSVGTHKWYWTDPLDRTSWSSLDTASAEANPDIIVALHTFWRELYLFGQNTVEIWYNAGGDATFERLGGGVIEVGCAAPYSVVRNGGTIFWLDHQRRFVKLGGRQAQSISQPIQRVLDGFPYVADAVCYPVNVKGRNFIVLNFPTANQTWCYDVDLNQWARWGAWNSNLSSYDMYSGISSTTIDTTTATSFISQQNEPMSASMVCSIGEYDWNNINGIIKNSPGGAFAPGSIGTSYQTSYATGASIGTTGEVSWDNINNILSSPNHVPATAYFPTTGALIDFARPSDEILSTYSFSIPTNAVIKGIKIGNYCKGSHSSELLEISTYLKQGSQYSEIRLPSRTLPTDNFNWVFYGGENDLWGMTWDAGKINNLVVSHKAIATSRYERWVQLDSVLIQVFFEAPYTSCFLIGLNFGFSIPSSTIQGVKVVMNVSRDSGGYTKDLVAQLVVNGQVSGENKARLIEIPGGASQLVYGDVNDLWGLTLTNTIINSSDFGFAFKVLARINGIYVNDMTIYVYYSIGQTPFSVGTGILIGDKTTGKIYEKKADFFKDDTNTIRLERRSGNITHNTLRNKRCRKITMRFKRGIGTVETPSPSFNLRWKDNNKTWSQTRVIDMGGQTATDSYQDLHRLGIYKSRQYEIIHNQPTDFIFVEAEEESEVLMS